MKIKLDEGAYLPIRGHETDAGLDLRTPKQFWLYSGHYLKIDTGVHVAIPEGMVGLITSKSGLMAKGSPAEGRLTAATPGASMQSCTITVKKQCRSEQVTRYVSLWFCLA